MARLRAAPGRVLPALLIAAGVTLVAAGLLTYLSPPTGGPGPATASPTTAAVSLSPSPRPTPTLSPSSTPEVTPAPTPAPLATRVVVPALEIDLPIVAGDLEVPGNIGNYPLCDVAQYLTDPAFVQPGEEGTTYLYGHAREGMFLPLLEESQVDEGTAMIDMLVQVYTVDARVYLYEIFEVRRHATDFSLAVPKPGEHRLILQTSEGPRGTVPKLQVAATLLDIEDADPADARPSPEPRACG
jgi:hypothetical protein